MHIQKIIIFTLLGANGLFVFAKSSEIQKKTSESVLNRRLFPPSRSRFLRSKNVVKIKVIGIAMLIES